MTNKEKRIAKLDRLARVKKARLLNEPKKVPVKKTKPTPKDPTKRNWRRGDKKLMKAHQFNLKRLAKKLRSV